jgi:hypothetical protein
MASNQVHVPASTNPVGANLKSPREDKAPLPFTRQPVASLAKGIRFGDQLRSHADHVSAQL